MTRLSFGHIWMGAVALTALVALVAAYFVSTTPAAVLNDRVVEPLRPGEKGEVVSYTLKEGASAGQVGNDLERLGIVRSSRQFQVLVSLMGLQDRLSAGDHELTTNSAAATVIRQVTVAKLAPTQRVTFPEGIRIEEMAALAAEAGFGSRQDFLDAVAAAKLPPGLAATLPEGQGLQGYLFPDTYILPAPATAADLVKLMIETLNERFTPELRAAALAQGLDPHQALTLASIVEREAVLPTERPLIAGVFYNRLAEGDLLGADPTTQFAAALDPASVEKYGWWKKVLTIDDLENPSKYNTRLVPGLPPGPITNPGLASIEAVANPEKTKFYYFVANALKKDGSHVFAETIAEHEQNKARYGQ
ncbi:MAG: endolytic transglycosylase MltG [Dehalococcoidia bacterium]|nr:endolytic transglycosylase MltG [Chloroflexi bacterium CFX7]MCK6564545.1 endolytic transglycosylase MltG [Dehalococcoidia bacterium]MCL4230342.1 endolytic transglycosylase MltG [Dehalococcoidia bacterium]NUQ54732.1 endolytic transglycosylase MltG [Dehalococcoidia bacterium]